MPTTDPYHGCHDLGTLMPTYQCEACGVYVFDAEVQAELSDLTGSASLADVEDCAAGAACPDCGHVQE
jgi:rubredoxin